jgi:hypothetical protein
MKRIFLASMLITAGLSLMAQNVDKAKDLLQKKKLPEARAQIDKALENPKRAKELETWYTKARIYIAISEDSIAKSGTPDAREQAFDALKTYISMDRKGNGKLIMFQLDQYRPLLEIYQGYYRDGAALYNSNNFKDAFTTFKKCLEVGDSMIANKWTSMTFDTSVILYTGISAERSNNKDTAAVYYAKLADRKVTGNGIAEIYKWLTDYYYQKQDTANTEKFIKLGKELYPNDSYWTNIELEMASNSGDKTAIYRKYDEMLIKEPTNYIYPYNYGVELYREIYAVDADKRPDSARSAELINKAEVMIRKSLELKPDYIPSNVVLGQILYNQAVEFSTRQRNFKPGIPNSKLTPEEIKQKEDLKAAMMKKFDEAIPYLEKVGDALGSQGKLKHEDRNSLKNAYDALIIIYDMKGNKEKKELYEEKYNNVDKVHN